MSSRSHLVPKVITDKNGHKRTVRVKPDDASATSRVGSVAAGFPPAYQPDYSGEAPAHLVAPINKALNILRRLDEDFPQTLKDEVIAAANSSQANHDLMAKVNTLAEACEAWNFHDTANKLWAAVGRYDYARTGAWSNAYSVAYDPATPPEMIRDVWKAHPNSTTSAGSNPSTPPDVLAEMAKSDQEWTREVVAKNPNLDVDSIIDLSKDSSSRVRRAVAENESCPGDVLDRLAFDDENLVRAGVVFNPKTDATTLNLIFRSGVQELSQAAERMLKERGLR